MVGTLTLNNSAKRLAMPSFECFGMPYMHRLMINTSRQVNLDNAELPGRIGLHNPIFHACREFSDGVTHIKLHGRLSRFFPLR